MRTFRMSENAITYYPSLLYFRLNTLSSFNLLSYGFKLFHPCGCLPPNPVQFLYLSLRVWRSPDMRRTAWSTKHGSQWTTLTFSGLPYTPVDSSCVPKEYLLHLLSIYSVTGTVSALHAMTERLRTSLCAGADMIPILYLWARRHREVR